MALDVRYSQPDEKFSFTLESINSAFGISAETLKAIASSYDVPVDRIIRRAVTQLALLEIPDLDLDDPFLTSAQTEALCVRRISVDEEPLRKSTGPSLLEVFKAQMKDHENDSFEATCPAASGEKDT